MLEPLATSVINTLLAGRPLTGHSSASLSFRMAAKMVGSTLPSDFFTPHPRRAKGKERAAPGRDLPDVAALSCASAPPPCTGAKRASSLRSSVTRMRARRLSTRKTMHAPVREPLPSVKPFTRPANMAQRRHASSIPESCGASGSSAPAWQRQRWHQSIRNSSSGRTSDLEHAWQAFEDLRRNDECESLEVHDMLDFASRLVTAAAADRHLDSVSPDGLRSQGDRVVQILERLSLRVTDDSPVVDILRRQCLSVSAAAMEDRFDAANEGLRELLAAPVGDDDHHQYVAEMLNAYATALYVHHSALSVLDVLLQHWSGIRPYLVRSDDVRFPNNAWPHVRELRGRFADVVTRVEKPTLAFTTLEKYMNQRQQQRVGEYLVEVFCQKHMGLIALDVLGSMKAAKFIVALDLQLSVVKALVKDDSFEQANHLFLSLVEYTGKHRHFDAYQEIGLYLFAHQGDVTRAQEYYGRLAQRDRVNTTHKALMLHAHAVTGNTSRVTELFYHFFPPVNSSATVEPPNIYHYTAVILAYAKRGDLTGMNTWLTTMGKAGIAPDAHVYNIILKSFSQRGDVEYMAELLNQMRASGVRPSRHAYTTILAIFAERRDVPAAEELYQQAMKDGIVPDRMMMSALMNVYVQAGDWQGVVRTFDYLKNSSRRGIRMSIEVYNTLLKAYVLIGAPFRVVASVFQKFEAAGLRPDAYTFAMLIQSACDSGLMSIANDLLAEMNRLADEGQSHLHINVYVLTIMMIGWLRAGQRTRAREIYEGMRERGIQPSAVTYSAIVKEYVGDKSDAGLQIAQQFVRNLSSADTERQPWTESSPSRQDALDTLYAPLLAACAHREQTDAVEGLVTQLEQAGGSQTLGTLTQLLDVHRRKGNGEVVRDLWPRIYELAVKHTQVNTLLTDPDSDRKRGLRGLGFSLCIPLSIYIDAMSSAGFHTEVAQTWAQLQQARVAFDSHNWNHLAVALVRAGEPARAFEIVERVIIPTRRRIVESVTSARDRIPASPISPVDGEVQDVDEEELLDGMIPEDDLPDGNLNLLSPRPQTRDRRVHMLRTNTRKSGDDLEGRSDDFVHGLHILHQVSPVWHDWRPHVVLLAMLDHVMHHLSHGRLVQPVRPAGAEPEPFPTMQQLRQRRARASDILQSIQQTCPLTVRLLEKKSLQRKSDRMRLIESRIKRDSAMNY